MSSSGLIERFRKQISASLPTPQPVASAPKGVKRPEKRRFARFSQEFETGLLDEQKRPADGAVNLVNMSCSGVAIESTRQFDVGDRLGVQVALDGGREIYTTGRICWGRPEGYFFAYGVQLEGLGFWDRNRLFKSLNPGSFSLIDFLNLLLEASATLVGCYVAIDWLTADPERITMVAYAIPWVLYAFIAVMAAWLAKFKT